jgi:hypothetical protein
MVWYGDGNDAFKVRDYDDVMFKCSNVVQRTEAKST